MTAQKDDKATLDSIQVAATSTGDQDAASSGADWSHSRAEAHAAGAPIVTIIGDGQLARMMHQAGIELGLSTRILAGGLSESAAQVASDVVLGDYRDHDHVQDVSAGTAAVTFDHEHVPNAYLDELIAAGINVQPQPRALINAQDKLVMRKRLREIGAPVPPFAAIESATDAREFWAATGGAVCLKSRRGGYDGKGVWFPASEEELCSLVESLLEQGIELLAEKKVELVRELSAMVARTPSGEVMSWPVVESVQSDGVCVEAVAPAPVGAGGVALHQRAEDLARAIVTELEVTGVLAVELFETVDELGAAEISVNELAMRPHNTGHWTQDGCVTSQFEQHLRAVLDWPLGSTDLTHSVTVMANVLGADADPELPMPQRMVEVWRRFPQAKIHLYGKTHRARRKIGHVNLGATVPADASEDTRAEIIARTRREARLCAGYLVNATWDDEA